MSYQQLCRGLGDRWDGVEAGRGHQPRLLGPVILGQGPVLRGQQPLLLCQDQQVPLLEGQEGGILYKSRSHRHTHGAEKTPFPKGSAEPTGCAGILWAISFDRWGNGDAKQRAQGHPDSELVLGFPELWPSGGLDRHRAWGGRSWGDLLRRLTRRWLASREGGGPREQNTSWQSPSLPGSRVTSLSLFPQL